MHTERLAASGGLSLAADVAGDPNHQPVLLLHGGGQTRGAWKRAAETLADVGYYVISLDLRGHGESDWHPDGDYTLGSMAADIGAIASRLKTPPALVGASLGGLSSLLAVGEGLDAKALVLVDVVPKVNPEGAAKIGAFMMANPDGFASLDEVADAVAAYMPHRPRPRDVSGLRKNVREENGRLYWHWDPKFMQGGQRPSGVNAEEPMEQRVSAAANVRIPTLLVRGLLSDIVDEEGIRHLRDLIPHAEMVDVEGAGHMVAGDKNDAFNRGVIDFLARVAPPNG
ncbi:MAG: alpha/beta hydrolase [Caulobacterales bacterium]